MPSIRGTSEGPETSELEYSMRRIQICFDYFSLGTIWKVILKKEVKNNLPANRGTSEGPETSELEYLTRQIQVCRVYFCSGIIWNVISKKDAKNGSHNNILERSGFSLLGAFQRWSLNCRSLSGSLTN